MRALCSLRAASRRCALSLLLLSPGLTFAADPVNPILSAACDEACGVYKSGQEATFTITRTDATETSPVATIKILRNNKEALFTGTMAGNEAKQAVPFTPPSAGWYTCSLGLSGTTAKLGTGIVVNPDAYQPSMACPKDFDDFWAAQKARLAADRAEAKLTPLTDEQLAIETANPDHKKKIEGLLRNGFNVENLEIPCLDVRPVEGYFATPKAASPKGHPAILFFHAAGVDGGWCRATAVNALVLSERFNALVVDMNAHGMLNGQPQDYYTGLANGELKGYPNIGRDSREKFYFLGMFLRLMRAIDFVCSQPEWDGKHLICIGISQGGAQTLAAAGLDQRVSAVVATVPGMCDLTGPNAARPAGWPGVGALDQSDPAVKKYFDEVAPYFDAVNFCARSKAESLLTVGFVDVTCPAPGIFTAYNQLKPAKRIITVPDKGHKELSTPTPELNDTYNAFVQAHCKN